MWGIINILELVSTFHNSKTVLINWLLSRVVRKKSENSNKVIIHFLIECPASDQHQQVMSNNLVKDKNVYKEIQCHNSILTREYRVQRKLNILL